MKLSLFITAFLPLWCSMIVTYIWSIGSYIGDKWCRRDRFQRNLIRVFENNVFTIIMISIILSGICICCLVIKKEIIERKEPRPKARVCNVRRANKLSSEFLLAYVLPMVSFDFLAIRDIILFIIYFITLAIICLKNNNVYTNIFLELYGFNLYECDLTRKVIDVDIEYKGALIISRLDLTQPGNSNIDYYDFDNYVYINLKEEENE